MTKSKELCAFFYEYLGGGVYRCKECRQERKQREGSGYTNLIGHLESQHSGYKAAYSSARTAGGLLAHGFVSESARHRYLWMQWVISRNMPVSEVDNALTRSMVKWPSLCSKTLLRYMRIVAEKVGKKVENDMGDMFALLFDGWTHVSTHYVAVYAVYAEEGARKERLLALSPLEDGSQDADAHIELFVNVLRLYNKTIDMVAVLIGDNCATNQSIATKLQLPLLGCASHRFNLAVNRFLSDYEPVLSEIDSLMSALRRCNNAAMLAKHTELRPIKRNATRWSSSFDMLDRYLRIRDQIKLVEPVEDLVPSGAMHKKLVSLHSHLERLDSVCKALQSTSTSLADVRTLFDSVALDYPALRESLKPNARIVHSPLFESALVKLCRGDPLSSTEAKAVSRLECAPAVQRKRKDREIDYASSILSCAPSLERQGKRYVDLATLLPPTSNTAERLFSRCKLVLTPQRSCMLPANFEMICFLRENSALWDASSLHDVEVEEV